MSGEKTSENVTAASVGSTALLGDDEPLTAEQLEILENIKRDPVRQLCFGAYLGETCQGCGKTIDTYEDMMRTVWWPHDKGRIGHKRCYLAATSSPNTIVTECGGVPSSAVTPPNCPAR